jgi:hypothetical protein
MGAKAVALRQPKQVLLSPDPNLVTVLTTTGIDSLVPDRRPPEDALAQIGA